MLLWLIYTVRDFMETVYNCSAYFGRALGVVLLQQQLCSCAGFQKADSLQCVGAAGEARAAEAGFLCERHQGQCRGGAEADDQADKAHSSQVSIPRGVGRGGEGQSGNSLPALWQQGAVLFTLRTVYINISVEMMINVFWLCCPQSKISACLQTCFCMFMFK